MKLSVSERKEILKKHGFYSGKISPLKTKAYKEAVKAFNTKYLTDKSAHTTTYWTETDNALLTLKRLEKAPHFTLDEFACNCKGQYCKGYPAAMNQQLLINAEVLRNKYGKMDVTSGLRCKGRNESRDGSVSYSGHLTGDAMDCHVAKTNTESGRLEFMAAFMKLLGAVFTYAYLPKRYRTAREKTADYMGNAVHIEVRKGVK